MKRSHGPDILCLAQQGLAALHLRLLQFIKRVKVTISDAFVGQGPEPLAWLQFGRVGR